jgi:hypothetical protein
MYIRTVEAAFAPQRTNTVFIQQWTAEMPLMMKRPGRRSGSFRVPAAGGKPQHSTCLAEPFGAYPSITYLTLSLGKKAKYPFDDPQN